MNTRMRTASLTALLLLSLAPAHAIGREQDSAREGVEKIRETVKPEEKVCLEKGQKLRSSLERETHPHTRVELN